VQVAREFWPGENQGLTISAPNPLTGEGLESEGRRPNAMLDELRKNGSERDSHRHLYWSLLSENLPLGDGRKAASGDRAWRPAHARTCKKRWVRPMKAGFLDSLAQHVPVPLVGTLRPHGRRTKNIQTNKQKLRGRRVHPRHASQSPQTQVLPCTLNDTSFLGSLSVCAKGKSLPRVLPTSHFHNCIPHPALIAHYSTSLHIATGSMPSPRVQQCTHRSQGDCEPAPARVLEQSRAERRIAPRQSTRIAGAAVGGPALNKGR
jgi:hypothetical protein